jgi:hypothetical protein
MNMPLRAVSVALESGRSHTLPVSAVVLKPSYRDITEKAPTSAGGRSYEAELYTNNGTVESISCVFWGPIELRQNIVANTPYLVFGGRLTDSTFMLFLIYMAVVNTVHNF